MYTTLFLMHVEGELLIEAEAYKSIHFTNSMNKKENTHMQAACAQML